MKHPNPFDTKLEIQSKNIPEDLRVAAVYVTDTLDLAWAAAQSVFEDQAQPEHAIAILKLWLDRLPPRSASARLTRS
ncbi:hypothetical protein ACW73L_07360 [Methylolobus aquaticus]